MFQRVGLAWDSVDREKRINQTLAAVVVVVVAARGDAGGLLATPPKLFLRAASGNPQDTLGTKSRLNKH